MTDLQGAGKLWLGKDYVNYLVKDFVNIHEAYNGSIYLFIKILNINLLFRFY